MKAGLVLPQTGDSATREIVLYIAKEAERQGLNSVWVIERLLWPLKPKTPDGGTADGNLPVDYQKRTRSTGDAYIRGGQYKPNFSWNLSYSYAVS